MVVGKLTQKMGLQKPPPPPPPRQEPLTSKPPKSSPKTIRSRAFSAYFPRASAQVHPPPANVVELIREVEELRETVSIVPILETLIAKKNKEIGSSWKKIEVLERENEKLRREIEVFRERNEESERRVREMECEIVERTKTASFKESEEHSLSSSSSSAGLQGLVEVSNKSNLIKKVIRTGFTDNKPDPVLIPDPVRSVHREKIFRFNSSNELAESTQSSPSPSPSPSPIGEIEKENEKRLHLMCNSEELTDSTQSNSRSRAPRVPKPPPRPSTNDSRDSTTGPVTEKLIPPPPPPPSRKAPPPPPLPSKVTPAKVRRVPEVVEFYHSLMRRDMNSKRDSSSGTTEVLPAATTNNRDMIGEIENRSTHLLAIKTDVETQGDFIRSLIKEVESAKFTDIKDVLPFVKWLDDELSYLVDERAVLKHFNWPEQKADSLREAAFGFSDIRKVEFEASSFRDDPRQPCSVALKKMQSLLEKLEHGVYALSRMRESTAKRYKCFQIPVDWLLETGMVSQIKLASVKLAMKYMKRVSAELETVTSGLEEEELIVQGVRFAFRVHQFAGGFDVETMRGFQELRDKARLCHIESHNQNQQKNLCRSTTC